MISFKIIPVLDILNSTAVHAIKGERNKYKPLKSELFSYNDPIEIIETLKQTFGFSDYYMADLDAIIKRHPNLKLLTEILDISNIKLMLDPGIVNKEDIIAYSMLKINNLILGLETIESLEIIEDSLKILGQNKVIVSIDMYKSKIISNINSLKDQNLKSVIQMIEKIGVNKIILLDLYRVGQKLGGIPPLFLEIRQYYSGEIFVGGGIRDIKDILGYMEENFSGVLIATALYDGTLDLEEIKAVVNS